METLAPTNAAARIVKGSTIHAFLTRIASSRYGFEGTLLIDEVSMMKVEQLYQMCLRLQEVMERQGVPFGGVCIICFGDMMQLRPVRGNYIFTRPKTEGFAAVYDLASR